MRANTRAAHRAFLLHAAARPAAAIWTDGEAIYSYGTAIVVRHPDGGYVVNATTYSVTTTIHTNALLSVLPRDLTRRVDGLPMGTTAEQLLAMGRAAAALGDRLDGTPRLAMDWGLAPGDADWDG